MTDRALRGPSPSEERPEWAEGRWSSREGKDPAPHPRPCVARCHRGSGRCRTVVGHTNDSRGGAPGSTPGAFRGPAPRTVRRAGSRRTLVKVWAGEPVRLYVTVVALAGVALTVWLIAGGRFRFEGFSRNSFWPGDIRPLMFASFILIGELFSLQVPRGNDTADLT